MRIGLVIDRWEPHRGGAEACMAAFAEHALVRGHEVHVFGLRAAPDAPGQFHAVRASGLLRGDRERAFSAAAAEAAGSASCDVTIGIRHVNDVDVYWPHGGSHAATLAAGEASRGFAGGAISRMLHRVSPRHRTFLAVERELLTTDRARRVWCVSAMVERELTEAFPSLAGRTEVHENGIDLGRFDPGHRDEFRDVVLRDLRLPQDQPVLLFLGGNWRLKGWKVLLSALSGMGEERWTCIAAGHGHEAAATDVERAGLNDRVRVVPHQDPRPLYAAADLLVQPTFRDPASRSTVEALACGVAVVTTTANGSAEAIRPDLCGSVVPPGRPGLLATSITWWTRRLAEDPVFRVRARREAREAVRRRGIPLWGDGLLASLSTPSTSPRT